jgi:hypothetical protein
VVVQIQNQPEQREVEQRRGHDKCGYIYPASQVDHQATAKKPTQNASNSAETISAASTTVRITAATASALALMGCTQSACIHTRIAYASSLTPRLILPHQRDQARGVSLPLLHEVRVEPTSKPAIEPLPHGCLRRYALASIGSVVAATIRRSASAAYSALCSIPRNRIPSRIAAMPVVPLPVNGSSTNPLGGAISRTR